MPAHLFLADLVDPRNCGHLRHCPTLISNLLALDVFILPTKIYEENDMIHPIRNIFMKATQISFILSPKKLFVNPFQNNLSSLDPHSAVNWGTNISKAETGGLVYPNYPVVQSRPGALFLTLSHTRSTSHCSCAPLPQKNSSITCFMDCHQQRTLGCGYLSKHRHRVHSRWFNSTRWSLSRSCEYHPISPA